MNRQITTALKMSMPLEVVVQRRFEEHKIELYYDMVKHRSDQDLKDKCTQNLIIHVGFSAIVMLLIAAVMS